MAAGAGIAVIAAASWPATATTSIALGAAGAIAGAAFGPRSLKAIAAMFERQTPASRNLVLTAAELLDGSIEAPPAVAARIYRDAAALVSRVDATRIWPLRQA